MRPDNSGYLVMLVVLVLLVPTLYFRTRRSMRARRMLTRPDGPIIGGPVA